MIGDVLLGIFLDLVRVLIAVVLSAGALYSGMNLFDRLTAGIDEWKEIKKGNLAIGLLLSSVMVSIMLVLQPRIVDVASAVRFDLPAVFTIELLLLTLINYLVALLAATVLVFLILGLIDRLTPDLDEMSELKKGNLAVALVYSLALVLVIFAVNIILQNAFGLLLQAESLLL